MSCEIVSINGYLFGYRFYGISGVIKFDVCTTKNSSNITFPALFHLETDYDAMLKETNLASLFRKYQTRIAG